MRSSTQKPAPAAREVQLERGMGLSAYARRQTRIVCVEGEVEVSETIMWIGAQPLRITRRLRAGDACRVEESGWLILRADAASARLQLEAPPPAAAMILLAQLRCWLSSHLHLPSGTAQAQ
ncbi:hypothetical protein [Uliginosibacterium sp. 31-12]|uniref:hypothetical protein n=1 Tax=Uliginosibacterium sp. 31-12 TaxID=3062781 RepID=UPI0026E23888|nr:hypothetical protein [Uliginosibacterium sp. 31-12]MDO6388108.1 hypothetical protein [Uliginosibacterium sp. 31-12]